VQDDIKGGMLVDLLYTKLNSCNVWVRAAYTILFQECYKVLYNQLAGWILYGKLLDSYNEFFIHKIESMGCKDIEKDWDSMFTLELSMLPSSIISKQTAEKVLFIGKSIRILRYINKEQSLLPPEALVIAVKDLEQF
jgi:gamma-tubulin complex component 4